MLVMLLLAFDASALRKVDPGKVPTLKPDEGLLVVSVDTSSWIDGVRFERVDGGFGAGSRLNNLSQGRTIQLYAVPVGQYRWSEVTLVDTYTWRSYFKLSDDPEYRFEVKLGQITYAGDLIVRPNSARSASMHIANRSLPVIDWLQKHHPKLYADVAFGYSGYYPDPFPEFYRKVHAAATDLPADLNAGRAPPESGPLALSAKLMWTPDHMQSAALSPDGALIAEMVREGDEDWAIDLIDIVAGSSQRIAKSQVGFGGVEWESDRILLVSSPELVGERLRAFVIGERKDDKRRVQRFDGPVGGTVVDLLPDEPAAILYEAYDSRRALVVHRLAIDSQVSFGSFRNKSSVARLNRGVERDLGWYADGHGQLRVALAKQGEDVVMMHGQGQAFREVMRYGPDNDFTPVQLSFDGDLIYGLSDEGREQRDFVVFDPAQGKVTKTLFTKAGIDVVRPLFDARRNPIGVTYYQGGRLVSDYFDEQDRAIGARLRAAYPDQATAVLDRSKDGQRMLLWVDASDQPPKLYFLDLAQRQAQLIDEAMPDLAKHKFVPTQVVSVPRAGGQPIDAFLTLPPGRDKRPLVVMAHGGPIGAADRLHFDREVQYIASLGYAVLQVNFRGSDGYGRAFRESARNQYGTGIEDDIDAALQMVLAKYPLDDKRMCMLGTSYGGYSALVSAVRWPDRFRCVVSISGVSDRVLFFTASDGGRDANGRAEMERWIGDPRKNLDQMVKTSPLYQYQQLALPLMLVHGREDLRVDFEHTRRLVRLLNLAHRTPVVQAFPNEGHTLENPKVLDIAWSGIAGFLREHLGGAPAAATTTAAAPAGQ
ncbi:MAG TPA: alpha/beta fold hydrolase [Lysobacter sp.]